MPSLLPANKFSTLHTTNSRGGILSHTTLFRCHLCFPPISLAYFIRPILEEESLVTQLQLSVQMSSLLPANMFSTLYTTNSRGGILSHTTLFKCHLCFPPISLTHFMRPILEAVSLVTQLCSNAICDSHQ
jgi:hypothetical protein